MRELQRIRLKIDLPIPLKNTLTPSYDHRAFFAYMEVKRQWKKAIPEPAEHQRALGPRSVRIVRLMRPTQRPYDQANVWFSAAAILDILVKKGFFVDDTEDLLELMRPVQRYAVPPDEEGDTTWIEIEDLPGPAVRTPRLPGMPTLPPVKRRRARPQGV